MADNIQINAASGTPTVKTTDRGSDVHVQFTAAVGNVDHDAVDADYPVKIGGKAATSLPTAVANADRVNAWFDANGRLYVTSDVLAGSICKAIDNAAGSTDTGVAMLATRVDSPSALTPASGDYASPRMDSKGRFWVDLGAINATDAAALADSTANPTTLMVGAMTHVYNGSTWDRLRGSTTGLQVIGPVAHDGVYSGNPVPLASYASQAAPSAVSNDGDVVRLWADRQGRQAIIIGTSATHEGPDTLFDSSGDNTSQQCKASAGSLCGLHVGNPNGSISYIQLFDASTGSVTPGSTTPKLSFAIPANGNLDLEFVRPIAFSTAITYTCTTTATGGTGPGTALVVNMLYK